MNLTSRLTSSTNYRSASSTSCIEVFFSRAPSKSKGSRSGTWTLSWAMLKPTLRSWRVRMTDSALLTRSGPWQLWNFATKQFYVRCLGATEKAATKSKPAPLPCRWKSWASGKDTSFHALLVCKQNLTGLQQPFSWDWVVLIQLSAAQFAPLLNNCLIQPRYNQHKLTLKLSLKLSNELLFGYVKPNQNNTYLETQMCWAIKKTKL